MPASTTQPISKQLTIVIGLTVVGFMAFGLALSFYRNILFEQTLLEIESQNEKIAEEIEQGYQDLEYYRSAQFKDKFAKENLNRLNPGEFVVLISEPPKQPITEGPVDDILERARRDAAFEEYLRQLPVWEHWKLYLFNKEKIEELRRTL
jgi:hypothetical protein